MICSKCGSDRVYRSLLDSPYCPDCKHVEIGGTSMEISERTVQFCYKNHRGEKALRTVTPIQLWHGKSKFHGEEDHHFLECYDHDRKARRDFTLEGIDMTTWKKWENLRKLKADCIMALAKVIAQAIESGVPPQVSYMDVASTYLNSPHHPREVEVMNYVFQVFNWEVIHKTVESG